MWQQLQYFKEYKAKLRRTVGWRKARHQIKEAIFYINAGSEDFVFQLFSGWQRSADVNPSRRI